MKWKYLSRRVRRLSFDGRDASLRNRLERLSAIRTAKSSGQSSRFRKTNVMSAMRIIADTVATPTLEPKVLHQLPCDCAQVGSQEHVAPRFSFYYLEFVELLPRTPFAQYHCINGIRQCEEPQRDPG